MNQDETLWQTKLAAWTHDPAEKALVLFRDPQGHEGGTVRALLGVLFGETGLSSEIEAMVRRADHWAAAADRPQWPRSVEQRFADQVRFYRNPVITHPLTGEGRSLGELSGTDIGELKADSFDLFNGLIHREGKNIDYRRTQLAFWRFGASRSVGDLGLFWGLLPADSRVPDHTIWSHVDLTSTFAGSFAADPQSTPALLSVSLGPVQSFIAQARTTSDLWAGSHLLSRLSWEAIKVVAERFGPDAILFPQLRGVPEVDAWLLKEMDLKGSLFDGLPWRSQRSDANPLFAAALPNRFLAVVPRSEAGTLAKTVGEKVRGFMRGQTQEALRCLLKTAGYSEDESVEAQGQIDRQLAGFPEVHWAMVPWSLVKEQSDGKVNEGSVTQLKELLERFYPEGGGHFLASDAWKLLGKEIRLQDVKFFKPNAGVLYPALYDGLDRLQAAAKSVREFDQSEQRGYRCSLCGEREWLTTSREQLGWTRRQRMENGTLWSRVAASHPAWARPGEHLCALCATKRLWSRAVIERAEELVKENPDGRDFSGRFVVSTHTLALAPNLLELLGRTDAELGASDIRYQGILVNVEASGKTAALPKRLADDAMARGGRVGSIVRKLPAFLDQYRDLAAGDDPDKARQAQEILDRAEACVADLSGGALESYYGVIRMDGDRMGAWLNGTGADYRITYRESWHPQVQSVVDRFDETRVRAYADLPRPPSPSRHMEISQALNRFALELARPAVEELFKGKLLYAGGDDVLALVSVDDLVPAMTVLRLLYSGIRPGEQMEREYPDRLWKEAFSNVAVHFRLRRGYVLDRRARRLHRVMGPRATASCGAVIAHHMTPLDRVLREARAAEHRAKEAGGRDAFSISVMKRSGGDLHFTARWSGDRGERFGTSTRTLMETPAGLLLRLSGLIADGGLSRRATYHVNDWIRELPPPAAVGDEASYRDLVKTNLCYQLKRQAATGSRDEADAIARVLADTAATSVDPAEVPEFVAGFLGVAEYLARGLRSTGRKEPKQEAGS